MTHTWRLTRAPNGGIIVRFGEQGNNGPCRPDEVGPAEAAYRAMATLARLVPEPV